MNAFEGVIEELNNSDFAFIQRGLEPIEDIFKDLNSFVEEVQEIVKEYKDTGVLPSTDHLDNWEDFKSRARKNSTEETVEPNVATAKENPKKSSRPRRNAAKEAAREIAEQSNPSLSTKLRRPTNANAGIKKEKFSSSSERSKDSPQTNVKVKTEGEEMPALTRPASKRKRQGAKTQVKQEKIEEEENRDSDVIAQGTSVPTVDLVDSETEGISTSTGIIKTIKGGTIKVKQEKFDDVVNLVYSSEEDTEGSKFQDAMSTLETGTDGVNATFVVNLGINNEQMNATIRAYESPQEETLAVATRTTRSKTCAQTKEQEEAPKTSEPKTIIKEKTKMQTPVGLKFVPTASSTLLKTNKFVSLASNESLSSKTASVSKLEPKRRKIGEATKKQAQEKKWKLEEKQLRAQHQREVLAEQKKLKSKEEQMLKEERYRKYMEKKQNHKEEQEKRRIMAKEQRAKLGEGKMIEEELPTKRHEDIAKMLDNKREPVYMKTRAPLLPSADCYDSDEERHPRQIPLLKWEEEDNLVKMLKCMTAAGEKIKNTFFSIQAQTPDLLDIFEVIESRKLKRTSSAVWDKPPRFTMIPQLQDHDERAEYDEDD